jgi:N-acylneuraminate cytidylyltransferase
MNLAVIPARAGSKRIPEKNIRELCGKPVIAYTIGSAIDSGIFDQVVVTTDSPDIAAVAKQFGAEVPFLRDSRLSDDHTPVSLATLDALMRIDPEENRFSNVVQLMPNCPLRTAKDIKDAYLSFTNSGADSMISVTSYGWSNPWWAMEMDQESRISPIFQNRLSERSQDLPELFCPTGAIWLARARALRDHKTFHIDDRIGHVMAWKKAIDIDTEDDWDLAELLMSQRGKNG